MSKSNRIISSGDKLTILDKKTMRKKFIITDEEIINLEESHEHVFNKHRFCTICLRDEKELFEEVINGIK